MGSRLEDRRASAAVRAWLERPVDPASLVVFRVLFGLAMLVAVARFFAHGWIHEYYLAPTHFFHYYGFAWVRPWPGSLMYVHYALMGAAALGITLGVFHRASAAIFFALFTYAHFIDKTNYLNHYYLVSCLALVMAFLPLDRAGSVRTWLRPSEAWDAVPAWMLYLVRFQVGVVYVFGGVAKLGSDWLVYAEPLSAWLAANADFPIVGSLFHSKVAATVVSWSGALFDLSVVPLLAMRRTRPFAYAALVFFHLVTARLFQLGMFPWIMMAAATIFFDASWPRRLVRGWRATAPSPARVPTRLSAWTAALLCGWVAWHVLVPLRHRLYPGNVLWTEEGFRFAWKVMLVEKNGVVEVTAVDPVTGELWVVEPRDYLTPYQIKMMSTQPDMILEFSHVVAEDFARRGRPGVRVHVDARVSLNGRPQAPLIDESFDLAREVDGFAAKRWILPLPEGSQPETGSWIAGATPSRAVVENRR